MAETDESLPRLLGGRYRLEATIGHGGMGVVYRATDLTMKRPVAVKLIRGEGGVELDEDVAGRFLREAKNTARIQHENIIEVFDLGRSDDGDLFFVMELLEGESLSARLRREGPLSPDATVHIARQICEALHVAHAAGIIHRDLKPANVMLLERAGVSDYVKVLDFGVAKSYSSDQQTQLTHTGMLVGTIEYMAPEQIMGKTVDGRTDVYSLGVVVYRMLAGKPPFRDGGVPALIHAHLNVAPKALREVAEAVPPALELAVMKALSKNPADRHATMQDFAHALISAVRAPEDLGLVNLAYDDDPYNEGDQTEYVRPSSDLEAAPEFDDATVKMERREPSSKGAASARAAPIDFSDRTAVMAPREESTAKRDVSGMARAATEPKTCAMCQTVNPPHVRACAACGVSLDSEEQAAVRARVAAPRTAHAVAPMPPPVSGAFPAGQSPQALPLQPPMHGRYTPSSGVQGVPWGGPQAPRAPSMWERFLSWTGLKTR
jgi:serine/threonine-protein kinase